MSKQNQQTDYAAELEQSYAQWDDIFSKGCSDPFWSDGVNLNLVRSHIIGYKEQLADRENTLLGLPDIYYRETPPEVDKDYMARPDEIRANARKAMGIIDADENLKFIREQSTSLSEQQIKRWCIPAIINYAENLRRAIAEDDLITMRRYEHPDGYLDSFKTAARKIKNPEGEQRINNDQTAYDPVDDEEFEDGQDECSDPEQSDDEELSSESEQDECVQLTLF